MFILFFQILAWILALASDFLNLYLRMTCVYITDDRSRSPIEDRHSSNQQKLIDQTSNIATKIVVSTSTSTSTSHKDDCNNEKVTGNESEKPKILTTPIKAMLNSIKGRIQQIFSNPFFGSIDMLT